MGLNVNYGLFKEGANSSYHIPEYKRFYNPLKISEDTMFFSLVEFNQQIRECQYILSNLYDKESINESTAAVNITNTIRNIIKKVKDVVINILNISLKRIRIIIDNMGTKASNAKDFIEKKYKYNERISMLKKALGNASDSDKTICIGNIIGTKELLNKDFPDTSIIGGDLMKMATDTMNNYCTNIVQKDGLETSLLKDSDEKASESFTSFIESHKDAMLGAIFGKYDYDPTNIMKSASDTAVKAFGTNDKFNAILTVDLYLTACDNLDNDDIKNIVSDLKKIEDETSKNITKVSSEISNIERSVSYLDKMANKSYKTTIKEEYYKSTRIIIDRINRSLNVIHQVVDAATILLTYKMNRIYNIYGASGDSMRIKKMCHSLIADNVGINENDNFVYDKFDSVNEDNYIQNDFVSFVSMAEDALMEREFSKNIITAILEAEGDSNTSTGSNTTSAQATTTEPAATETKQNIIQKAGSSILQWLKDMIGKVGNTLERFKSRIEELVIKNVDGKTFWDKNKDAISKLALNDTKVNQWYKFNIDAFAKSTYVKFDINSNDLKSDEDMQNAILKKITSNPPAVKDGESFKDRINHAYQGEYVDDKNGEGQPLSNVGYDHTAAYTFIDDFVTKGFGGDTLGNVTEDYKNLDTDFKNIGKNYNQLVEQRKASNASSTQSNIEEKKTEPQNASAMIEDDFKFNLAEHFGLITNEASFTVGKNDSQNASTLGGGNNDQTNDKELDEMIRRCFKYNTIAITAKMTCALSAYKQYMGLFKAVYGSGKKESSKTNENNK